MAADRVSVLVLLVAALLCFAGAVRGAGLRPRMVGAPQPIENPENDEGLERALQFAMTAYNRASNDMYSSRVVRVISAQRQIVAGVKYIMEVEIARTTCTKPATDIQHCAFHEEPQMAKHTICNFVVLNVPWKPSGAAGEQMPVSLPRFQQRPATSCSDLKEKRNNTN
uniref:Egg-white cystatin n=1 Tax=Taeniopygia guttata TaxID=59729 RepID=H0Z6K2_TAEGU